MGPPPLERHRAPFDVAELTEAPLEDVPHGRWLGAERRDTRHGSRLLCHDGDRGGEQGEGEHHWTDGTHRAGLLTQTSKLSFRARVLVVARDAGGDRRLKHPDRGLALSDDQQMLAGVEIGLALSLPLEARIGVAGRLEEGLGRQLACI